MFDGGEAAAPVAKAGCEDANKCCLCIDIACGLKIVAVFSWIYSVIMIIFIFTLSAAAAIVGGDV